MTGSRSLTTSAPNTLRYHSRETSWSRTTRKWVISTPSRGAGKSSPFIVLCSFLCSVHRGPDGHLGPAAHPLLVGQVLLPEGALQIPLFPPDHLTLDNHYHQRQQQHRPQRVTKNGDPGVDHRESEIAGVAGVAEGTFGG